MVTLQRRTPEHRYGHCACWLTKLPDEVILMIGQAIARSAYCRLADLVATAKTCSKLYNILIDVAYLEAIMRDSLQVLQLPLPKLTHTSGLAPMPIALWAAERDRLDTVTHLWQAQGRASTARLRSSSATTTDNAAFAPLTSAFLYPLPPDCQRDPAHTPWGHGWPPEVHTLGREEPEPVQRWESGWCTALHLAARGGHDDMVRSLVSKYGAYVDATACHVCVCRSRHMRHIKSTDIVDEPYDAPVTTPLHVALANGRDHTARLLVELGAEWSQEIIHQPCWMYQQGGYFSPDPFRRRAVRIWGNLLWWDNPHNHTQQIRPMSVMAMSISMSPCKYKLYNSHGQCCDARLGSSLGVSFGASGLRIAAANGLLPFLGWLIRTKRTLGAEGEFHEPERMRYEEPDALHFAACASVGFDGRPEASWRPSVAGSGDDSEAPERAAEQTRMEQLVTYLLALGVQWPHSELARSNIIRHARYWRNHALAEFLEHGMCDQNLLSP